jgi:hypothetical protein
MFEYEIAWEKAPPGNYLILDVENGPSWGWGPNGYTYSQVFCIAWKWLGADDAHMPQSVILDWRADDETIRQLLAPVYAAVDCADGFVGHNFDHDKGLLVGTAKDCGAKLPGVDKPVIDTMRSVPSSTGAMRSLEAMCDQFGLGEKPHLSTYVWKQAWVRWDPDALRQVRERCVADVVLTERLYEKEKEMGWL